MKFPIFQWVFQTDFFFLDFYAQHGCDEKLELLFTVIFTTPRTGDRPLRKFVEIPTLISKTANSATKRSMGFSRSLLMFSFLS